MTLNTWKLPELISLMAGQMEGCDLEKLKFELWKMARYYKNDTENDKKCQNWPWKALFWLKKS